MYSVKVVKLDETPKIFSSLKMALINSLLRLNRMNGRVNVIVDANSNAIVDSIFEKGAVCLYTQFGDQILVERIKEVTH